jgi:hypothetical protein
MLPFEKEEYMYLLFGSIRYKGEDKIPRDRGFAGKRAEDLWGFEAFASVQLPMISLLHNLYLATYM